ncbi:hypothetical protein AeRB84_006191, partial [Aphanomyces euteiches]
MQARAQSEVKGNPPGSEYNPGHSNPGRNRPCNSATASKAVLEPVEVANSVVCTLHTDTRRSDATQARETLHACQGKIAMRSRYASSHAKPSLNLTLQFTSSRALKFLPLPFCARLHLTEGHQTTLAALRTALGEDDLAALLGPMEEQQRLHLVEVIARYGDVVLAASLPPLQAQVVALQTEVATLTESNNQEQHALQESQANALQLRQQLGQAVAAHPQDAAPATTGEPKKVRVRIDFPPFGKSDNENLMRWISHVSLAAKAMHLDDEGAVAKAVTSLLGRPAEWAHGQLLSLHPGRRLPEQNLVPQERPREVVDYANRLRYIYTLMIDRDSLNEATRVSVFMNGLVESPSRSELFRRIPKTFEEAVEIALKEEFSQASAQGKSAGSDQWDMDVSSMEQFPQREAYRVPASAPPSQRPCFECNQLGHFARDCPRRGGTPRQQQAKTRYPAPAPQGQAQSPRRFGRSPGKCTVGGRRPTGRDKAFPFDGGGSGGIASGTLLCQLGQSSRMVSFEISIAGFSRPLKVLIDCAASENYARRETIASSKAMLDRAASDQDSHAKVRVKLASGQVIVTDRVLITLPTKIGPFDSEETFFVIDLDDRWDLILGMRWLEKHKPTIDWRSKTLSAPSSSDDTPLGVMSNELAPSSALKTQLNTRSRRTIEESIDDDDVLEHNSIQAMSATTEASGELAETSNISMLYDSVAITAYNTARNQVMFQELEGFGISRDGITKIYASHDAKRRRRRMARAAAWSQALAEETVLPAR